MEKLRLSRYLSVVGVCSRRAAELLIKDGRILINGKKAELGEKVDPEKDRIMLDNKPIRQKTNPRSYFMLNKPRGYVTTLNDEAGRKCVADLTKGISTRVYSVGRLDKESEGLLILTDDGDLTNKLTHPSKHIPKTYRVTVKGNTSDEILKQLRSGVKLDDGYVTEPAEVKIHAEKEDRTILIITIFEGKNRQIRRMCEAVNLEVLLLKRIAMGKISLGHLKAGEYRLLTKNEIEYLKSI